MRVTLRKGDGGRWEGAQRELVVLKANPFLFGHDRYTPDGVDDGGPFTIGRVIHSSRSVGFTGWSGGVAVFGQALTAKDMRRLARVCADSAKRPNELKVIRAAEIRKEL